MFVGWSTYSMYVYSTPSKLFDKANRAVMSCIMENSTDLVSFPHHTFDGWARERERGSGQLPRTEVRDVPKVVVTF